MVGYVELSKYNTFSMVDVCELVGNMKTASSLVLRLSKKGMVKKIRNNLYTCVNVTDGNIIASKYHIACGINKTAYISHHTAFEFEGYSNQVFYEVCVSSKKKFRDFEFDGITYRCIDSKTESGVISPKNTTGIRITSTERTVIDSIKDFEKIGGLEELINSLALIYYLDENLLKIYLDEYNIHFLYQKTGFILTRYKKELQISDEFIKYCKSKIGDSTRYLTNEIGHVKYDSDWKLVVPTNLFEITKQGGSTLEYV